MMAGRRVPEKVVQQQIVTLLRSVGARVYPLGTVRTRGDHPGTMMATGLPDLIAFVRHELVMIEVKADNGRVSMPQLLFASDCFDARVRYVRGGVDEVLDYLVQRGLVRTVAKTCDLPPLV